jgi:hypothetical protein
MGITSAAFMHITTALVTQIFHLNQVEQKQALSINFTIFLWTASCGNCSHIKKRLLFFTKRKSATWANIFDSQQPQGT